MADNYLEKRYEEVFGAGAQKKSVAKRISPSLNTLLVKNRTVRRYRQDFNVTADQLRIIVGVNAEVASAMNRQTLRFHIVASDGRTGNVAACPESRTLSEAEAVRRILFREQMLPYAPGAFIIVCTAVPEDRYMDIDLGISLQSMALKAVEAGLNCLIKGNIDRDKLRALLETSCGVPASGGSLEPMAVLCVGKAAESVFLKPVTAEEAGTAPDLTPYTKDGVHYVPKLRPEDLIV